MTVSLRVGTRRSPLARAQTSSVVDLLARAAPRTRFRVVPLDASGDRDRAPGGSPDFTDTLDRALLEGRLDVAVHSAKDLPVELDPRLEIVACPRRADARDCLVVGPERPGPLPRGARVGSSSLRRRAQLLRWRPDLSVVEIRGNVDRRVRLVGAGEIDAAILAVAGLARLGRSREIRRILPTSAFLPAPAQGALAVVARAADPSMRTLVGRINDAPTRAAVAAERAFAAALGGDCRTPLGALASLRGSRLTVTGEVLAPDGRRSLRRRQGGPRAESAAVGRRLGEELVRLGALDLVRQGAR